METQYDPTDQDAKAPVVIVAPLTTTTSFNIKGLPSPVAGWGKNLGTACIEAADTNVVR